MRLSKNIGGQAKSVIGIKCTTQSGDGTVTGTGIDRMAQEAQDGYMSAIMSGGCGDPSGTPTSFTVDFKLQDSADNSTYADVTGETLTQLTDDGMSTKSVNLMSLRQYVRVVCTVDFTGGTSPAIPVFAALTLGGATYLPPA